MCRICVNCGYCSGEAAPMVEAGQCPFCDTQNDPKALYCRACGAPLPYPPGSASDGDAPSNTQSVTTTW